MMAWYKDSYFYRLSGIFIPVVKKTYKTSLLNRIAGQMGGWYKYSRIHRFLVNYTRRESGAKNSFTYKALKVIFVKTDKLAGAIHDFFVSRIKSSNYYTFYKAFKNKNTNIYIMIGIAALFSGTAGALTSFELSLALAGAALVAALLLLDYQKATYFVAIYVFLDFIFRQFIGNGFLSSYWDELFFIFCVFLWFVKWLACRRQKAYTWTPLDFPIIIFFGVGIFLLIANSPDMKIGIDGLRAVIEYIFWFFIIVQLLKTERGAKRLILVLVYTGALLALHGIYQYVTGAQMPSNWMDSAEKDIGTRAFSIIGSPNILGSLMVMLIPVSASLFFAEKGLYKKLPYAGISSIMVLCLVVTFSRSAWLGFALAALVFFMQKDKRKYLPVIILGILVLIILPPVSNRISYMLSPDYIASSIRGGRLMRWPIGFKMLMENPLFGVGLGRFGGAVAINNRIPGAFYMDNYFLKTAVEMGFIGLIAFCVLIYNAVIWSFRTLRKLQGHSQSQIVQGVFAGICGIILPNFFENIFEVPMMVTYFWLLVGYVMFLGYAGGKKVDGKIDSENITGERITENVAGEIVSEENE